MIQNALTVDVEDYYQVASFFENVTYSDWDNYESRVVQNTIRLLDMFDDADCLATFFILGWVAEKNPNLVKEISSRGHEVASHGFSHQLIYKQDRQVFFNESKKSKTLLEDLTGKRVNGYRAASYSITGNSLWALDILIELGFQYDSSIMPIHHDVYGVPGAKRVPHVLQSPSGSELIEFPPTTLNLPGVNLPISGGGYFRLYPYWFNRIALSWINSREKIPFIFYLHPWEIDPDQPRIETNLKSRFRHYNNIDKTEQRLYKLIRKFSFTRVDKVLTNLGFDIKGE